MRILMVSLAAAAMMASPVHAIASADDESELVKLETQWAKAVVDNDRATLDAIIAPDWSNQGPYGLRTPKATMFASMAARRERTTSMKVHDLKVRVFGDIAIVQGSEDEVSMHDGRDTSGRYTFTDVFQRRAGRWLAIASQPTFVGRPGAAARTRSTIRSSRPRS